MEAQPRMTERLKLLPLTSIPPSLQGHHLPEAISCTRSASNRPGKPGQLSRTVLVQEAAVQSHLLRERLFLRKRLLESVDADDLAKVTRQFRILSRVDREAAVLIDE